MPRSSFAPLLLVLLPAAVPHAAGPEPRLPAVDAVFAELAEEQAPGCAVGVARGDVLIHAAGYGSANLEYDLPLDADSVFRTGSLSKQFTAAAVALAAEEGLLDLDAPLGTYLPELHPSVHGATVRQVVGHVGGLPDYESRELNAVLRDATGNPFEFGDEDHLTTAEFFEVTRAVEQLHPPGTRFLYSNIGYFWLGQLVERVTGESLRAYGERRIFGPAGMTASLFNDDANRVIPRRASGYRPTDDGWRVFETNLDWVGEGGVYTSVHDFARWNAQYRNPTIGADPVALRALLETPVSELQDEDGDGSTRSTYAFGIGLGTDDAGRPWLAHGGAWVAFRSYFKRFPEEDFAYWILCNRPDVEPGDFGPELERIFLDDAS